MNAMQFNGRQVLAAISIIALAVSAVCSCSGSTDTDIIVLDEDVKTAAVSIKGDRLYFPGHRVPVEGLDGGRESCCLRDPDIRLERPFAGPVGV